MPVAMDRVCPILRDRASGIPNSKPRGVWLLYLALSLGQLAVEVAYPHPSHAHICTHTCTYIHKHMHVRTYTHTLHCHCPTDNSSPSPALWWVSLEEAPSTTHFTFSACRERSLGQEEDRPGVTCWTDLGSSAQGLTIRHTALTASSAVRMTSDLLLAHPDTSSSLGSNPRHRARHSLLSLKPQVITNA